MNETTTAPVRPLPDWLDSCARPKPICVRRNGWEIRPVPDFPDIALIDRLSRASGRPTVQAWACNGPYLEFSGPVPSTAPGIDALMVDRSYAAVVVEAAPDLYLYKEPRNRYALALGARDLVEAVVPGSMDECRARLRDWIASARLTSHEQKAIEDDISAYTSLPLSGDKNSCGPGRSPRAFTDIGPSIPRHS